MQQGKLNELFKINSLLEKQVIKPIHILQLYLHIEEDLLFNDDKLKPRIFPLNIYKCELYAIYYLWMNQYIIQYVLCILTGGKMRPLFDSLNRSHQHASHRLGKNLGEYESIFLCRKISGNLKVFKIAKENMQIV